jgi:C1A family cysteine protease
VEWVEKGIQIIKLVKTFRNILALYTTNMFYTLILVVSLLGSVRSASVLERFASWANTYRIDLPGDNDNTKFVHMLQNWIENDRYIDEVNAKNLSYTLGHNHFSAMNREEFADYVRLHQWYDAYGVEEPVYLRGATLPVAVDWRANGAVTPVKNQGNCGSCWSFSTTGSLEGAYAIKNGHLISYSEQNLVDCDLIGAGGTSLGCNGGDMGSAMDWINKNGGLCTEQDYPYVSGTTKQAGSCKKTCAKVPGSTIMKHIAVAANSDVAMMTALAQQPVSVAIEADQASFQLYKSGVFTGTCGANLDHGVLLVGYGSLPSGGGDYYILKNSWDTTWGVSGYMYLGRGNDPATGKPYNSGKGQCGVLMQGVYPVL